MLSSRLSRRSDGRVGADASTLSACAPRGCSQMWHKSGPHSLGVPRAVVARGIEFSSTQQAIGEPEKEVAMAMQRDFLLLVTLAVAVVTPAFGQTGAPAV